MTWCLIKLSNGGEVESFSPSVKTAITQAYEKVPDESMSDREVIRELLNRIQAAIIPGDDMEMRVKCAGNNTLSVRVYWEKWICV